MDLTNSRSDDVGVMGYSPSKAVEALLGPAFFGRSHAELA